MIHTADIPDSKHTHAFFARRIGVPVIRIGVPVMLLLVLTASRAQAAPITLTWDFTIAGSSAGPFDGTRVFGELAYDYDPLRNPTITTYNPDGTIASIQYPQVPLSYLVLSFGGPVFGLSDGVAPAFFSPVGASGYGLAYTLRPDALPGGTTFSIVPAGSLFYSLSGPFGVHVAQERFVVPETASWPLSGGGSVIGVLSLLLLRQMHALVVRHTA